MLITLLTYTFYPLLVLGCNTSTDAAGRGPRGWERGVHGRLEREKETKKEEERWQLAAGAEARASTETSS